MVKPIIRTRACFRRMTGFSPVLAVRPFFHLFRYKIDFVWPWLRFLCDFVCLYALLFFRANFVSFFPDPGLSEGCKCS